MSSLRALLPSAVAVAESRCDASEDQLFPAEREVISNAVSKRRAEFSTVRACARLALAELGYQPVPILPGLRGAPGWPAGVVGSMTHCLEFRAAALAHDWQIASIGIDAEPHGPLPEGVLKLVARPEERRRLSELDARSPQVHWDLVLFSIKEAVYKAWFPLTERWLDFQEASVQIDPSRRCFEAALLVTGPVLAGREVTAFCGRFAVDDELVLTAIAIEGASPLGETAVSGIDGSAVDPA